MTEVPWIDAMEGQDFLSLDAFDAATFQGLLATAHALKRDWREGIRPRPLEHRTLAMIFEKQSLRTRSTFDIAMFQLGGHSVLLSQNFIGVGVRESIQDVAKNLERWVDGIMARTYGHGTLLELAEHADVPVINGLSDRLHPCQLTADYLTLYETFGDLDGVRIAFVGDGNNVARSLATLCLRLGVNFILAAPKGYELDDQWVKTITARATAATFSQTHDPRHAVEHADAIYTDTWVSMGQEEEKQRRLKDFAAFQINDELLAAAPDHAIVMHCLPAYRNVEITDAVMDGRTSVVFPQAHNRLHAQKGLLAVLLDGMAVYESRVNY